MRKARVAGTINVNGVPVLVLEPGIAVKSRCSPYHRNWP